MCTMFCVSSGVIQCGVLSPIMFAVYTNGLLRAFKNQEIGVSWHMGHRNSGAFVYADDLNLLLHVALDYLS